MYARFSDILHKRKQKSLFQYTSQEEAEITFNGATAYELAEKLLPVFGFHFTVEDFVVRYIINQRMEQTIRQAKTTHNNLQVAKDGRRLDGILMAQNLEIERLRQVQIEQELRIHTLEQQNQIDDQNDDPEWMNTSSYFNDIN